MVFIPCKHGMCTIEDHLTIFIAISGNRIFYRLMALLNDIPGTMCFHIGFIDDIETILITETVELCAIRIM